MPTLKQLRDYFRGGEVEGLPEREKGPSKMERALAELKAKGGRSTRQYTINTSGTDAIIHFGQHKGQSLTDILRAGNAGYLRWMLGQGPKKQPGDKEGFDADLLDVVEFVLENEL